MLVDEPTRLATRVLLSQNDRRDSMNSNQRRIINLDAHETTSSTKEEMGPLDDMDHSERTSSLSSGSSGIGVCDNFSSKKRSKKSSYRSLQKSKKSIKTIEATLRNSGSIEQWLNDFGKIQPDEQCKLKSSQLTSKMTRQNPKISSTENLTWCEANSGEQSKAVKRANSFCEYENEYLSSCTSSAANGDAGGQRSSSNTNRLLMKKKMKKSVKSKISLDEKEEMLDGHEDPDEEVKCRLEIETHTKNGKDHGELNNEESSDVDEQADELRRLLLEIHREHDGERMSSSSDASFKLILQQLIEASSKSGNNAPTILQGLVSNGLVKYTQIRNSAKLSNQKLSLAFRINLEAKKCLV